MLSRSRLLLRPEIQLSFLYVEGDLPPSHKDSAQFKLNVGCRRTILAITALSFVRILFIIANTCSSNSRSLKRARS
jgi:hypothetical protein